MLKDFIPICQLDENSILCLKYDSLYSVNPTTHQKDQICRLNIPIIKRLFMRSRFCRRYFGLYSIKGTKISDTSVLIYYHKKFFILNFSSHKLHDINTDIHSSVLHFSSSSIGPIWGEYGYNPEKNKKSIFRYNNKSGKIECLYTFPDGEINHIHNIVEDNKIGRFYILTGDFGNSAAIYYTDDKFQTVKPLVYGAQDYRACFAIPYDGGLFYATDSPTQINCLYFLKNGILNKISEINGSCIFACKYRDYFIGSTTVENQPDEYNNTKNKFRYNLGEGIKNWNVELFAYNIRTKEYKVLLRVKKDVLPMLAFGYGLFVIPVLGEDYTGELAVYGQSIKKFDQKLLIVEL